MHHGLSAEGRGGRREHIRERRNDLHQRHCAPGADKSLIGKIANGEVSLTNYRLNALFLLETVNMQKCKSYIFTVDE